MPSGAPNVGEVWQYNGATHLRDFLDRIATYCVITFTDRETVTVRYQSAISMEWSDRGLYRHHFLETFTFVPILPGLARGAVTFIENMSDQPKRWHGLPEVIPFSVKNEWDHLLEED